MKKNEKIYIAGHKGLVGSAFLRYLKGCGYTNLITATHSQLDLKDFNKTEKFFKKHKPAYVILAAAKVGGINANRSCPVDFLYDNLTIQNNVFHWAVKTGVKKLLFLGSSCVYPAKCPQPIKEEYLLTGPLEPTNEGYAIAKMAGLKLAEYLYKQHGFKSVCVMPCNLYGPNDSFHPENSHVLSALVKKFTDAILENKKNVILWGTGMARREFMHIDDMVRIAITLFGKKETPDIINIGTGTDISIKDLAILVSKKVGYKGALTWDRSKPDGMLKKCLDISKMKTMGLRAVIPLEQGVTGAIAEYQALKKDYNIK